MLKIKYDDLLYSVVEFDGEALIFNYCRDGKSLVVTEFYLCFN